MNLSREAKNDLATDRLVSGLARIYGGLTGWFYALAETPKRPAGKFDSYMEAFDALGDEIAERITQ